MTPKHWLEPWEVKDETHDIYVLIDSKSDIIVVGDETNGVQLRHAAACVNALAGLNPESVRPMISLCRELVSGSITMRQAMASARHALARAKPGSPNKSAPHG